MVLNSIDPQSMTNTQIQHCRNCGKRVSETDKFCPNCKKDLSKVGRHIALSLSDSIRISDYIRLSKKDREKIPIENIQWDSETLTFFGVIITVFLGITPFIILVVQISLLQALFFSFLITLSLFVTITKLKMVRVFLVKIIIWFLNKNE
mgnify:CR=1 FL=1